MDEQAPEQIQAPQPGLPPQEIAMPQEETVHTRLCIGGPLDGKKLNPELDDAQWVEFLVRDCLVATSKDPDPVVDRGEKNRYFREFFRTMDQGRSVMYMFWRHFTVHSVGDVISKLFEQYRK